MSAWPIIAGGGLAVGATAVLGLALCRAAAKPTPKTGGKVEPPDPWPDPPRRSGGYRPTRPLDTSCRPPAGHRDAEIERLTTMLESHAPEGHNVTNEQYVDMLRRAETAEAALTEAKADRFKALKALSITRIWCECHLSDRENDAMAHFVDDEMEKFAANQKEATRV